MQVIQLSITLAEVHVKLKVILMDLLGPDNSSTLWKKKDKFGIVNELIWTSRLVIGLKWTCDQKVAYVFVKFEWN